MEHGIFLSAAARSMYFLKSILLLYETFLAPQNYLHRPFIAYRFEIREEVQPLLA